MLQKRLAFRNAEIAYYIEENKGKETIVMLHPAFADHEMFEAQRDFFKEQYQVILLDMPGHGASQVAGAKVTLRDLPEIILRVLAEQEVEAVHLVGVSMGSLLAQAFADRYPERVQSVTIVGGYSIHKANEAVLKAQRKEGLKWMAYLLFSMNRFREHVLQQSCHSDRTREVFRRGIQKFTRKSFTAMSGLNAVFTAKDTPMPYPLLIVAGKQDLPVIREAAMALHKAEPLSQLAVLPEAGHCANLDDPEAFNRIVQEFLLSNNAHPTA